MKKHAYYVARRLNEKMGWRRAKEIWRNLLRRPTSRVWALPASPDFSVLIKMAIIPLLNKLHKETRGAVRGAGAGPVRPTGWLKVIANSLFNIPKRKTDFPQVWEMGAEQGRCQG